jgi:putative membrane protein
VKKTDSALGGDIMRGPYGGFYGDFGGFHMFGWFIGLLIAIALVVALVLLLVWLWRRAAGGRVQRSGALQPPSSVMSAKEILQARYARGEITREQYLQMRDDLG